MGPELHPDYLQHIRRELPAEQFAAFRDYCSRPLRKSIRVNTLKCEPEAFFQRMVRKGWHLEPIPWCRSGFWLERDKDEEAALPLGNTPEHLLGLFYIQEASSMLPPEALLNDVRDANMILDVAAAPGSKTTQMAAMLKNRATVVANELSASRLKSLYANLVRTGVWNVCLTHHDGRKLGTYAPEAFDAVLLDAPCGGEGTVRKDPDALKHWSLDSVRNMAKLQYSLLEQAFLALKVGGSLVYSTCTLSPEENEQVVANLLDKYTGYCQPVELGTLFPEADRATSAFGSLKIWPHLFDSEGFFVAKIRKTSSTAKGGTTHRRKSTGPMQAMTNSALTSFLNHLDNWLRPAALPEGTWCCRTTTTGVEVWLLPRPPEAMLPQLYPDRCGIRVADIHRKGRREMVRWHHEFAIAFGHLFQKHVHEISLDELALLYRGNNLTSTTTGDDGDWLVRYQDWPVGWVRKIKGRLKNNLPRERLLDRINWQMLPD